MVTDSFLKHLLSDDESLSAYLNGTSVSFETVKRHLFLIQRRQNSHIPDHHYRLSLQLELGKIDNINLLICEGLGKLSKKYLYIKGERVYVKNIFFNDWQQLITYIPPLVLQMGYLNSEYPILKKNDTYLKDYFHKYLIPNLLFTALPYPYIMKMEEKIKNGGFNDLHIHLNGSIETDKAWQDFLRMPDKIYEDLKLGALTGMVLEQLKQESHQLEPLKFYRLLKIARKIREVLYEFIFPQTPSRIDSNSFDNLMAEIISDNPNEKFGENYNHPFKKIVGVGKFDTTNDVAIEGLMYMLIFSELKSGKSEALGSLFHFYLLVLGLSNRLLVQQLHQYGFEQFQKHTLNNLRDQSEKAYEQRFFQMHGNELRNLSFLEGRFSPKKSALENEMLFTNINKGWNKMMGKIKGQIAPFSDIKPKLNLVAHFIKQKESSIDKWIRHKRLRIDIWERASVLMLLLEDKKCYRNVVGIDAAASEFDTPPEVFGPVFRRIRRKGIITHFTYHVGEDFYHIISGLRAIYESITFTGLSKNDRIGHATAAGIDPQKWFTSIGEKMYIKTGEHLDNLIFIHSFIISQNIHELEYRLNEIEKDVSFYIYEIYRRDFEIDDYTNAWILRQFCPIHTFSANLSEARANAIFDIDEWVDFVNFAKSDDAIEILKLYHNKTFRVNYDTVIEIETAYFDQKEIEILQLQLLAFIKRGEIIIETLPTSNVRISHYKDYTDHHLWRWKEWKERGEEIPPIVVGTDDTGIFATSIFNEYAHIYCANKGSEDEKMLFIESLLKNGSNYCFMHRDDSTHQP